MTPELLFGFAAPRSLNRSQKEHFRLHNTALLVENFNWTRHALYRTDPGLSCTLCTLCSDKTYRAVWTGRGNRQIHDCILCTLGGDRTDRAAWTGCGTWQIHGCILCTLGGDRTDWAAWTGCGTLASSSDGSHDCSEANGARAIPPPWWGLTLFFLTFSLLYSEILLIFLGTAAKSAKTYRQCCGSGSVGSIYFWASRIRIHS